MILSTDVEPIGFGIGFFIWDKGLGPDRLLVIRKQEKMFRNSLQLILSIGYLLGYLNKYSIFSTVVSI